MKTRLLLCKLFCLVVLFCFFSPVFFWCNSIFEPEHSSYCYIGNCVLDVERSGCAQLYNQSNDAIFLSRCCLFNGFAMTCPSPFLPVLNGSACMRRESVCRRDRPAYYDEAACYVPPPALNETVTTAMIQQQEENPIAINLLLQPKS